MEFDEKNKDDIKATIQDIVGLFANTKEGLRAKQIKEGLRNKLLEFDGVLFSPSCEEQEIQLNKQIDELLRLDKANGVASELSYKNGKYYKRKGKKPIVGGTDTGVSTDFIGRAGECAVMSELLYRGYNANRMMVDEGVDIIAEKNNIYYYIQVKTTSVRDGRIYASLPIGQFAQFINNQIRYYIVARYSDNNVERFMFFMLSPQIIQLALSNQCAKQGANQINLKIRFNEKTGEPLLYDVREMPISLYKDNFDLDK